MFELASGWGWLALAYIVGTLFGLRVNMNGMIGATIDSLIEQGYLRTRKTNDGEIEILKNNES